MTSGRAGLVVGGTAMNPSQVTEVRPQAAGPGAVRCCAPRDL
jgi:hypothetical protein